MTTKTYGPVFSNALGNLCGYNDYKCYNTRTNTSCDSGLTSFSSGILSYYPQSGSPPEAIYYFKIYGIM